MATTEIKVKNMPPNWGIVTDGANLAAGLYYVDTNDRTGVIDVKLPELLVFHVKAGAAAVTVNVGPGSYPPALAAGQGEVSFSVPAGKSALIGPFESGRVQSEHVTVSDPGDPSVVVHGPVMVELDGAAEVSAFRFPRNT